MRKPAVEDAVLLLETRNRVYKAVQAEPGIHLSEVARRAGLLVTHARYHLDQLVKAGLLSADAQAGFSRYYTRHREGGIGRDVAGRQEKAMLDALRRRACLHLVLLLLAGPSGLGDLAARFGRTRPTVLFHLERLVAQGLVERRGASTAQRTFALREPDAVLRLLVRFPPPRPLVSAFESLWDGLALPKPDSGTSPGGEAADASAPAPIKPNEGPSVPQRLWRALSAFLAQSRACGTA